MNYRPTIGLEVHAELKTRTKMFCDSKNDPDEKKPNVNICPVCMGHPGTLPTINKEAVKHVLKLGVAVGGELADFTEFDRKNYFYPDLPKGYQISQYKFPLVKGGSLNGVQLTRIHLEEDTARSVHEEESYSLVDFNRAGIPLMELVTEPVVKSAEEAGAFARELQLLLRYLGAGEANMEKGEMRVEANVSVSTNEQLGTKVEIKNLNSFRSVERAIEYEIKRHTELLGRGAKVIQETRGWDEAKGETYSQRLKEDSHDYRYLPDPDLPKLYISEVPGFEFTTLAASLPELPWERRARYLKLGLKEEAANVFVADPTLRGLFEGAIRDKESSFVGLAANYLTSDLIGLMRSGVSGDLRNITGEAYRELIELIYSKSIGSRVAKNILLELFQVGGMPNHIVEKAGLLQQNDEAWLTSTIEEVISENEAIAEEYRKGKESALHFLIGKVMQKSKGTANPMLVASLLKKKLF